MRHSPPQPTPRTPRRPPQLLSRRVRQRRTLAVLFLLYIAVLALVAFWPSPVDQAGAGTLNAILRSLHGAGLPGWINYTFVESVANVVLFIPFGGLVAAWLPARWIWVAAVAGIAASCIIESVQAVMLPDRFSTIYDVNANSLGAALGCLAVYAWRSRAQA